MPAGIFLQQYNLFTDFTGFEAVKGLEIKEQLI
jgi:hypothetical protein